MCLQVHRCNALLEDSKLELTQNAKYSPSNNFFCGVFKCLTLEQVFHPRHVQLTNAELDHYTVKNFFFQKSRKIPFKTFNNLSHQFRNNTIDFPPANFL